MSYLHIYWGFQQVKAWSGGNVLVCMFHQGSSYSMECRWSGLIIKNLGWRDKNHIK